LCILPESPLPCRFCQPPLCLFTTISPQMYPFDAVRDFFVYPCLLEHFHYTTFGGKKFIAIVSERVHGKVKTSVLANLGVKILDRRTRIV